MTITLRHTGNIPIWGWNTPSFLPCLKWLIGKNISLQCFHLWSLKSPPPIVSGQQEAESSPTIVHCSCAGCHRNGGSLQPLQQRENRCQVWRGMRGEDSCICGRGKKRRKWNPSKVAERERDGRCHHGRAGNRGERNILQKDARGRRPIGCLQFTPARVAGHWGSSQKLPREGIAMGE